MCAGRQSLAELSWGRACVFLWCVTAQADGIVLAICIWKRAVGVDRSFGSLRVDTLFSSLIQWDDHYFCSCYTRPQMPGLQQHQASGRNMMLTDWCCCWVEHNKFLQYNACYAEQTTTGIVSCANISISMGIQSTRRLCNGDSSESWSVFPLQEIVYCDAVAFQLILSQTNFNKREFCYSNSLWYMSGMHQGSELTKNLPKLTPDTRSCDQSSVDNICTF